MQVGKGKVSLADVFAHSYQESKVPIITPVGKHAGEVELFFVFAAKEVRFSCYHRIFVMFIVFLQSVMSDKAKTDQCGLGMQSHDDELQHKDCIILHAACVMVS